MKKRDVQRLAVHERLKWVVAGSGPALRPEADMRAILAWIDKAIDARRIDAESFEGAMLQALLDNVFTIEAVTADGPTFQLTDYGRARVDSMPHTLAQLTEHGVKGTP